MKTRLQDLLLFGGQPAFPELLHVGRPNIGDRAKFMARMEGIFDRRWLTNDGPLVREFEQKLAEIAGVKHCICVCNATDALGIAIRALDLRGEVIVPSFTFVATAHSLQWQEITPVFCDIDPVTHTLDPAKVERLITPKTTGIIGVHLWGRPCDVESLEAISRKRKLALMFDAAHAFGCASKGRMVGNFGSCEVYSFHATKFLNSFEGGAVATNDDDLAKRMRLMRNFGFAGYDNVVYLGTNGKMCEASAAMGLTGLESMNDFITINRRNYDTYHRSLKSVPGLRPFKVDESEKSNYQYVVYEVDEAESGLHRDQLLQVLHLENVLARKYFFPGCHRMEPYKSFYPHAGLLLPVTERVCDRVLVLPTGTAVGDGEINAICEIIRTAVGNAAEVRQKLRMYAAHETHA